MFSIKPRAKGIYYPLASICWIFLVQVVGGAVLTLNRSNLPVVQFASNVKTLAESTLTEPRYEKKQHVPIGLAIRPTPKSTTQVKVVYSGTATFGEDYTADQVIEFKPGQPTQDLNLNILADQLNEGKENIVITLVEATGAVIGPRDNLTLTVDDPGEPVPTKIVLSFEQSQVAEGKDARLLAKVAEGSQPLIADLNLDFSIVTSDTASDVTLPAQSLTVSHTTGQGRVAIAINRDEIYEGPEVLKVNFQQNSAVTFVPSENVELTILDGNEAPRLRFAIDHLDVKENEGRKTLVVKLEGNQSAIPLTYELSALPASADPAQLDVDFRLSPQRLTFEPNGSERQAEITFEVIADELREPNPPQSLPQTPLDCKESVKVVIKQMNGRAEELLVNIVDDDFWNGDLLLIVPLTEQLLAEPDMVRSQLEDFLRDDERRQSVIGGSAFLMTGNKQLKLWPALRGGEFQLDPGFLNTKFDFFPAQVSSDQLIDLLTSAAKICSPITPRFKGRKFLGVVVYKADTAFESVRQLELPKFEGGGERFLLTFEAHSKNKQNLVRNELIRTDTFKHATILRNEDRITPMIGNIWKEFRQGEN